MALLYSFVAVAPVLGSSKLSTACEWPGPKAKAGAGGAGPAGGGSGASRTGGGGRNCCRLCRRHLSGRGLLTLVHIPLRWRCLGCTSTLSSCDDDDERCSACAEEACSITTNVPLGSSSWGLVLLNWFKIDIMAMLYKLRE